MVLLLLWVCIACCLLGCSAACDLDQCVSDYVRTFIRNDHGCHSRDADLCREWRSYYNCLVHVGPQCDGFLLLDLKTRISVAKKTLDDCHCSNKSDPSVSTVFSTSSGVRRDPNTLDPLVVSGGLCSTTELDQSYTACVMFGDPHLVTVSGQEQTCSLLGIRRLFGYGQLTVDVENVRVSPKLNATGTKKVIVRYGPSECVGESERVFTATPSDFRATFDDGGSDKRLIRLNATNLVELKADWLGVKILVRRVGTYLTLAIQILAEIQHRIEGLCRTGCPANEVIQYKLPVTSKQVTLQYVAVYACDHLEEDSFFFDSCVFDLTMTGDGNFSLATVEAMNDLNRLRTNPLRSEASSIFSKSNFLKLVLTLVSVVLVST